MSTAVDEKPQRGSTAPVTAPPHPPVPDDDAELCDEIATLAGHIAAATCRFLVLLGELDVRGAWAGAGILGPAHWLSFRCGMGEVAAREHVRVARALRRLPRTVEAFGAGRLSYSKVRAITRVATPDNEVDLVALAMAAPANHVERLVRGLRTAQSLEDVRVQHARHRFTYRWGDDGFLLVSGRFAPDEGTRIVETLEEVRQLAEHEMSGAAPLPEDDHELIDPFGILDEEQLEKAAMCARVDPEVRSGRSLADAFVELCTMARLPDTDVPRTSRPTETVVHVTLDDLQDRTEPIVDEHGENDEEDREAASELAPETAEPARGRSTRRRREEPRLPRIYSETVEALAPQSLVPPGLTSTPRVTGGPSVHPTTAQRLACDAGIVLQVHENGVGVTGRTLEVGARVRKPNAAVVRALLARDGGCRYPGCARRRNLHAHHVRFWSLGGPTTLANMVLLCGTHHRLLHEGGYSLSMTPDGAVTIRDRRGRRVVPVPPTQGSSEGLRRTVRRQLEYAGTARPSTPEAESDDATIGPWTVAGRWGGEPLDLGYATSILMEAWKVDATARDEGANGEARARQLDARECGSVEADGGTSE